MLQKVAFSLALTCFAASASAWPLANVTNLSDRAIKGVVGYAACPHDNFYIEPGQKWEAESRAGCLITKVGAIWADEPADTSGPSEPFAYYSSGTGYACFEVWAKQNMSNGKWYPWVTRCADE